MRHSKVKSVEHEEELYRRARVLSRKLKIPFMETLFRVSLVEPDGSRKSVIDRHSRSLVRNFYNRNQFNISGAFDSGGYVDGALQAKDTSGDPQALRDMYAQRNLEVIVSGRGYMANVGEDTQGIQIGTGTTAESFDDYTIETLIDEGAGAGEMRYSAIAWGEAWNAGGSYYEKNYERVIDNDSGSTIYVSESALIWFSYYNDEYLMSRDVFTPVDVLHNKGIAIFYGLRLTYP